MSILIKGINLPKGDPTVALLIEIPCEGKATCEAVRMDRDGGEDSFVHEIEVEEIKVPHGQLKDADALKVKQQEDADLFKGSFDFKDKIRRDEALNAVANIVNAPTVIEAEE